MFRYSLIILALYFSVAEAVFAVENKNDDSKNIVIENGTSDYCIYYSNNAPASVKLAAVELRSYFEKTSGVLIPVISSENIPKCSLISLGVNSASDKSSIYISDVPIEGYRIVVQQSNIFILGYDTRIKQRTTKGGQSAGTLNGVYEFIERYLGVRWLMPGEIGEYVPKLEMLEIKQTDFVEFPFFLNRRIPYIQDNNPLVKEWLRRQKQGYSLQLNHAHSFTQTIPEKFFDNHPEWFPMSKGKRIPPVGRYKLETTNQELVNEFSRRVIDDFDKTASLYTRSISPSDSGNWSDSVESLKLQEKDPTGALSVTPLVLDFYNNVARNIADKYPEKKVCGYIYSNYLFPPEGEMPILENNLCLVVAPSFSYGYGLYRNTSKIYWKDIIEKWSNATNNIAYYDLPVMFESDIGAPNPPGLEILSYIYPELKKNNIQGVYIHGVSAWGHGGLTNYLLAKLNWNPDIDVYDEARKYLVYSYGLNAGSTMYELYMILDDATKRYHSTHGLARHNLNKKLLRGIYLPILHELEALYEKSKKSVVSTKEKKRLDAFGNNMALFYDYLVKIGLLKVNEDSQFYRSPAEISMIRNNQQEEILYPPLKKLNNKKSAINRGYKSKIISNEKTKDYEVETPKLRGASQLILLPKNKDTITVNVNVERQFNELITYRLQNYYGDVILSGDIGKHKVIKFTAKSDEPYYLDLLSKLSIYKVKVINSEFALNGNVDKRGLHVFKDLSPLYVYVPNDVRYMSVTINADGPLESAALLVTSPGGDEYMALDTSGRNSDNMKISIPHGNEGFWKMQWKESKAGRFEDAWIKLDGPVVPSFYVKSGNKVLVK